ncbi:MAG: type IV toxin-antitoxin system AbiEi family antitoxin domain-containing protein [Actinomycetes bacterium]
MQSLGTIARSEAVFLRRDALAAGMDDKGLRRAVRDGTLIRVRHGAYIPAELWDGAPAEDRHLIRAAAVMRTVRCRCALSHTTAAVSLGVDVGISIWTRCM